MGTSLRSLLRDQRGLASVEATIMLSLLAVAMAAAGARVAPAVHAYADKLVAATTDARAALQALKAAQASNTTNTTSPGV